MEFPVQSKYESPLQSTTEQDNTTVAETARTIRPDAGLRSLDHYKIKLPSWRYAARQKLIPLIRWETPYVAKLQNAIRSPVLDSYFSVTANLGTHTFFMIFLPILFWCGYTDLGRGLVHVLASGVFLTGFVKDLLCLPRPLSPPLSRISMSPSVSLEYGFPSTHSTNAVSVAVYVAFQLRSINSDINPTMKTILDIMSYFYATSIILGRLYCGMHGFFDVVVGAILGAVLSVIQCLYGETFDNFIYQGSTMAPLLVISVILILVRIHPEPADNCPCFDDSIAFAGVIIGVEAGNWHYARTGYAWDVAVPATVPFHLATIGWPMAVARIIVGVVVIFAWREAMKPALLRYLPPVFRVVESLGLSLPRKFFVQASMYTKIPRNLKTDNVLPPISEILSLFHFFRHPRKSRSVSVGPQSEADAYEALAFHEKQRRESNSSMSRMRSFAREEVKSNIKIISSKLPEKPRITALPTPAPSQVDLHSSLTLPDVLLDDTLTPTTTPSSGNTPDRRSSEDRRELENEERDIFLMVEKPRVRYDVEVITKLIVYTGIAWLAVEGNPIFFVYMGFGQGS